MTHYELISYRLRGERKTVKKDFYSHYEQYVHLSISVKLIFAFHKLSSPNLYFGNTTV